VRRVTFLIDGEPFGTEFVAPFDFAGTSLRRPCRKCSFNANPFESNLLSVGEHLVTADVLFRDGSRSTLGASFQVADTTSHDLLVSSTQDRSNPLPLAGATLSGREYLFLGPADDPIAGLTAVVFLIDGRLTEIDASAPYDVRGTTRSGSANALDTRRLANGSHQLTAIAVLRGRTITYEATFTVAN
jgi:hypothetical protein